MAETVNEQLRRRAIRHQIYTLRLAGGMSNRLISLIDKSEKDIIDRIASSALSDESWTRRRLNQTLKQIEKINTAIYNRGQKQITSELIELANYEVGFAAQGITTTLPIQYSVAVPSAALLESIVKTEPFEGFLLREWFDELSAARFNKVKEQLRIGVFQGESIDNIVKRVRGTKALNYTDGAMQLGRRQARALVRTAVNHVANSARSELYRQNKKLIKGEMWLATLDGRTTLICASRDGQVYKIGEGPRPPAHVGCRSTVTPVTKSWKELGVKLSEAPEGTRASLNGQVPGKTTFDKFLRGESKGFQEEFLGKTKAKLFRDGKLPLDRFVDPTGEEYTIAQLAKIERKAFKRAGIEL